MLSFTLLLFGPIPFASAQPQRPGREISLPRSEVKDSLLAYAVGVIHAGIEVELDHDFLLNTLSEFKSTTGLPFEKVRLISQRRTPGSPFDTFTVGFLHEMRIPVPFSLLGYHPGMIRSSENVVFVEQRLPLRVLGDGSAIAPLYVFQLREGYAQIDVDDWITFLFSNIIDDITIRALAVFRYERHWFCMLVGTGRKGQLIAGMLDFRTDRILFPTPAKMRGLAADLLEEAGSVSLSDHEAVTPVEAVEYPMK
jgi:hypothetical protein